MKLGEKNEKAKRAEISAEANEAIDKAVFDEEITADEYRTKTASTIDSHMLSKNRFSHTKTKTKMLKTTDGWSGISNAERYYPSLEMGLTTEQVNKRIEDGLFNYTGNKSGKSYLSIFLTNIFTFFNMLTFAVAIALLIFQSGIEKLFFMMTRLKFIIIM